MLLTQRVKDTDYKDRGYVKYCIYYLVLEGNPYNIYLFPFILMNCLYANYNWQNVIKYLGI